MKKYTIYKLFAIALGVLIASIITGVFYSIRKAKKQNETIWNSASRRLLINFSIPLVTGGFFIIFLMFYSLPPPSTTI